YTAAIALPNAPTNKVIEALINRGIAKGEQSDFHGAIADYIAAISLPDAPIDLLNVARQNLADLKMGR
uniref:hypothetical protein n=1 Tax=Caballeronia sp. ATUFL_F1_KS39 TaxID=2921766 RepID=UPI002028ED25